MRAIGPRASALLEMWREHRTAELAELIDRASTYSFPPLEEGPIARRANRDLELIARTPTDVRYLLLLLPALEVGSITAATIQAPPKIDTRALAAELQRLQVTS